MSKKEFGAFIALGGKFVGRHYVVASELEPYKFQKMLETDFSIPYNVFLLKLPSVSVFEYNAEGNLGMHTPTGWKSMTKEEIIFMHTDPYLKGSYIGVTVKFPDGEFVVTE